MGAGMSLSKMEWRQLDLFEKKDKKDNLLKAMDRVNERFGDWMTSTPLILHIRITLSSKEYQKKYS
jgi:hypothetical protein